MKMVLIHDELWDCVGETENKCEDAKKQEKALAKIALSVQPKVFPQIRNAKTAREAWTNLQKAYEDRGLCRRLSLLRTLFATKLSECASMEAYVNKIMDTSQLLSDIGSALEDDFLAVILLSGLTSDYDPLIMALENSNVSLSSEVVKLKLLQENLRRDEKDDNVTAFKAQKARKPFKCFKCKKTGHCMKDCPEKSDGNKSGRKSQSSLLTALAAGVQRDVWHVDSGSSLHLCNDRSVMSDFTTGKPKKVYIANGEAMMTTGKGTVQVVLKDNCVRTISNVYLVPKLATNLLSVSVMVNKGYDVVFRSGVCKVIDNGEVLATATLRDGTYQLDAIETVTVCSEPPSQAMCSPLSAGTGDSETSAPQLKDEGRPVEHVMQAQSPAAPRGQSTQQVWHRRLAHLNSRSMELLRKGMSTGISYDNNDFKSCVSCIVGKQSRLPFPKKSQTRAKEILGLVHSDVCGPLPCPSLGGKRYFLTFIDDWSRKTFVYFLKAKSEVFEIFKQFKTLVENQTNKKIKVFRSDGGGEYVNLNFQRFLKKHGIRHQTTVPRSSPQNGVAERANRSIMEKARCMLQDAGLKKEFWAEAVNTAVYLKNRSPTKAVMGCTPEERWSGKKENISYLRIFGCQAYALQHKRDKLDPKSKKYIFVGYCDDTKGYRLIDPACTKNVIKARNVTFVEHAFWNDISSNEDDSSHCRLFKLTSNNVTATTNIQAQPDLPPESAETSSCHDNSVITIDDSESSSEAPDDPADETYVPGDSTLEDCDNSFESASVARVLCSDAGDPQTVREALNGPEADKWKAAMAEEYKSFIDNKCWTLTDCNPKQRPVKCKWIFKRKLGLDGEILRYKARLVAKGYTQKYGIDYLETFSPVVRYSTIRTLLALAAEYNLNIEHLDVKTAFLNGDLKETVYMEQPEGYKIKGQEDKVYKLNKAIYGLKQASKSWYEKINGVLTNKLKFKRLSSESCVYVKSSEKSMMIIALYVDDIMLFSSPDCQGTAEIKEELRKAFEIKDLGPAHHILGMRLCRQNGEITLDQSSYIKKVLKRFQMSDCKPARTPMETGLKLVKSTTKDCTHDYRGLIGCLMYIAICSRPDIAYAVSSLSQFNETYDETHWKAAKRVLRYLKGTINYCLTFQKSGLDIVAYADADYASNEVDRRSCTGFVFKLGNSTISWESRKQRTVALSSTEAEYMSLSDACKEALFLRKFLFEIYGVQYSITLHNDNQSALKLCTNSMYHARTKHIDVRHHFIREIVDEGTVTLKYLPTDQMVADVLTKPLPKEKHDKFVSHLFVVLNK